tara:strand:+ start:63 stop:269 length:207 start_codon:yes stop_codon:yes gene_type:complete
VRRFERKTPQQAFFRSRFIARLQELEKSGLLEKGSAIRIKEFKPVLYRSGKTKGGRAVFEWRFLNGYK